ncbi:hypothetical protein CMQ_7868 [Grosmannia clavigera kw1407]|uniref:Uncharacterized protein n=1 Tax=Grosmannia clavigera (strain kw1407 / UAMH 11150) TaxID=655863 RepID=F0XRP6_GROCL|nr:uncharacterized protein CMQ_7868 [Grosmannia clavigera kw1407]EFW99500.1 hypothetical protein CMQ_7868 [Grosmannia clavigera kw1407]
MFPPARLQQLLLLFPMLASSQSNNQTLDGTIYVDGGRTYDFRPYLEGVDASTRLNKSGVHPGGQNFTKCCYKAVAAYIKNYPENSTTMIFDPSRTQGKMSLIAPSRLYDYSTHGQFPCGATYNGSNEGAPVVMANYSWTVESCPNWALSGADNLNAWLQPLSGVLLPAVVFCLSIPRRRRLEVPGRLFVQGALKRYMTLVFDAIVAFAIVTTDTVIWLSICFAFAGPMIISGLYEAMLDNYVLRYLTRKTRNSRLSLDMRCRCLMVILIGNLDLVWNTDIENSGGGFVTDGADRSDVHLSNNRSEIPLGEIRSRSSLLPTIQQPNPTAVVLASPWMHMEQFLYDLRLHDDDFKSRGHSPRQHSHGEGELGAKCLLGQNCPDKTHYKMPIQRTPDIHRKIHDVKTQLKTMLLCQYSFGSIVGAPVILALAFGQWYMTIPHIAIVSGLLLAGNNPNILEGVLHMNGEYEEDNKIVLGFKYGLAFPSCYKVAWLWNRGHNKKNWLKTLVDTYLKQKRPNSKELDVDDDMLQLQQRTTLSFLDWALLLFLTILLLSLPCVLALLTAYFTPVVGVSCRAITITMYLSAQIGQIILWLWAYAGPLAVIDVYGLSFFFTGGWLDRNGFYRPYDVRWLAGNDGLAHNPIKLMRILWSKGRGLLCWQFLWNCLYYLGQWLLGGFGVLAAIGGTLMQLMGVYSADVCRVTTPNWSKNDIHRADVLLSQNTAKMIRLSRSTWIPFASTAIGFMSAVSFVGWLYQRRMRNVFLKLATRIDDNECQEAKWSHPEPAKAEEHKGESFLKTPVGGETELLLQDLETMGDSGNTSGKPR